MAGASTDAHLRYVLTRAREESKDTSILGNIRPLVDAAFQLLETNFEKFLDNSFAAELLVLFAEVACLVPPPIDVVQIERALDLFDRCGIAENQFLARGYIVRGYVEAKKDINALKGKHLQLQVEGGF